MRCDSCEMVSINGLACHETGCPASWKDETRECLWCGQEFTPESREQLFDDPECAESYKG